jgi:hypothetical protein
MYASFETPMQFRKRSSVAKIKKENGKAMHLVKKKWVKDLVSGAIVVEDYERFKAKENFKVENPLQPAQEDEPMLSDN